MQTIHYISDKSAKMMFGQQGPVIEESFCELLKLFHVLSLHMLVEYLVCCDLS